MSDDDILALGRVAGRAARAYELGRLRSALVRALGAMALTGLAFAACSFTLTAAACVGLLGLGVTASLWRGGAWARGAKLGFAAGLMPCFVPVVLSLDACHLPGMSLSTICLLTGVAAGIVIGWRGARRPAGLPFWLAAGGAVLTVGAIGCMTAGLAGLGGLALGLAAGVAVPVVAVRFAD
jgi:hypothetical protein